MVELIFVYRKESSKVYAEGVATDLPKTMREVGRANCQCKCDNYSPSCWLGENCMKGFDDC